MFSIADAAVSGDFSTSLSTEARAALDQGNLDQLFAVHRSRFAGWTMKEGDDPDDDDDDDDADDGDDDDDDDDQDDDAKARAKEVEELKAENKRRRLKARQQDTELKELRKKVEELTKKPAKGGKDGADDDGKDDADDTASKELESKLEQSQGTIEDLLIRLEFMGDNRYTWKNPRAALKLLDLSEVDVDEDGSVEGLEEAIDKLAKDEPYLLKEDKDSDDDEDDEDEKDEKPKRRKTGQQTSSNRRRKKGTPNADALRKKYPALRR